MKISGSILAVQDNYMEYARQLKYVNVDFLHIDIFQDHGNFHINQLKDFDESYLPLDVHLIYNNICDDDIRIINNANVSYLTVQYENLVDKTIIPYLHEKIRANFGLAFTAKTPLEILNSYIKYCSQVLFMCSEPGVSGAVFDEDNYERIKQFHNIHPEIVIFVDGGITGKRSERMAQLGVSVAVSGSFLSKNLNQLDFNSFALKYYAMQDAIADNIMLPIASLPIVSCSDSFSKIINVMNKYRLGIVFVIEDDVLEGVIADGDIRRGFIKYDRSIFEKKASDLMNSAPYKVNSGTLIRNIYHDISELHKGVEVVPIIANNKMVGAIDLKIGK